MRYIVVVILIVLLAACGSDDKESSDTKIQGTVNVNNAPVANTEVKLVGGGDDESSEEVNVLQTVQTDAQGRFTFNTVEAGDYLVETEILDGACLLFSTTTVESGKTTTVDFVVASTLDLTAGTGMLAGGDLYNCH